MEVKDVFSFLTIFLTISTAYSNRVRNKTYIEIQGKACFRRMNGTHQIGCSSETNGNVGILHYITSNEDTEWLLNKAPNPPYIVMLNSLQFNISYIRKLRDSGKVNGAVVIHVLKNETLTPFPPDGFSPDKSCPNDGYGRYHNESQYKHCQSVTWNPVGDSMMFEDFHRFPIFAVINQTEVEIMVNCYEKYNKPLSDGSVREYPLCAVELKDAMSGAKDSPTCYRRTKVPTNLNPDTYCDPLGDENVIGTIKAVPNNEPYPAKSVVLAASRLDSFSMFENIYPSADNHVTGIVGLLAAAEALAKFREDIFNRTGTRDILFAFFQGEAFDYIGSSRTVYDMKKKTFPMAEEKGKSTLHLVELDHISHFVEVNQLGYRDDGSVWVHTDPVSQKEENISKKVDEMVNVIHKISDVMNVKVGNTSQSQPLPPASVQRFLREEKIPAVVITDHQQSFTNKYYNSRFDIAKAIDAYSNDSTVITEQAKNLTKISTLLARTLYTLSTGKDAPQNMTSSQALVNDMLYCFLVSRQCELFRKVIDPSDSKALELSPLPYPFYVSVKSVSNQVTSLTRRLLSMFIGDRVEVDEKGCKQPDNEKVYQYYWMQGELNPNTSKREPYCVKSTVLLTPAESPLFSDDTDFDWDLSDFPAWTESSWQTDSISMRIFLVPSKHLETVTLSVGVIITLLFMTMTYFINGRADIVFNRSRMRF